MRLDEACESTFARHETFHPRLGWFRKAFLASNRDHGAFFISDDAPLRLGVGKNMVRSIKFWGSAAHLITDARQPQSPRTVYSKPTNLGTGFLGAGGLDPFMENPSTWWWIHWMLLAPQSILPVWWILLNEMQAVEFDVDLAERACMQSIAASSWEPPHGSSVRKDIAAFLRTYVPSKLGARGKFDDQFGSPLQDLRLVTGSPSGYRLSLGHSNQLPGAVALAALLDYVSMTSASTGTASLARLATIPGAPGRIFRMSEGSLAELIEPEIVKWKQLSMSAPAGALQIGWRGDPGELAHVLLCDHYGVESKEISKVAGPEARIANLDPLAELQNIQQSLEVVL